MSIFFIVLNILCCLAAIWLLRDVLLRFFNEKISVITLLILFLGTNYFDLVTGISPAPVNYRFMLFVLLLWLTLRWKNHPTWMNSIWLGLDLGLIIFFNPTDVIFLLFPFTWGIYNRESFLSEIKKYRENLFKIVILVASAAVPAILMFIFWTPLCSYFHYLGYDQQGVMRLLGLYAPQVLFSWHNGWLVYTPIAILAIVGFYFLASREPGIFLAIFGLFFLALLTVCSWNTYDFADGLGRKMMIPYYPLLALPLGFLLKELNWKTGIPIAVLAIFFTLLNLFQTWQYREGILDPSKINGDQYSILFGKINLTEQDIWKMKEGNPDPELYLKNPEHFNLKTVAFFNFEDTTARYTGRIVKTYSRSGSHSFRLDSTSLFAPSFTSRYGDLPQKDGLGLRITAYILSVDTTRKIPGTLVITSIHKGMLYRYKFQAFEDLKLVPKTWSPVSLKYVIPPSPSPDDTVTAYVYYRGKVRIYVDDVKVELFEPKK